MYEMPILGLGTYALDYDTCVNSVKTLLQNGGRLIDTAYMYGNEDAVGEGVRQAMEEYGIAREEIFVITKIYPNQFHDPEAAIDMALEKLDIGYIDMMLLHHPGTDDVKAYKAMERYVEEGKIPRFRSRPRWCRMKSTLIIRKRTLYRSFRRRGLSSSAGTPWAGAAIRLHC